jgi:ATP-dependent DNA helicase RecG
MSVLDAIRSNPNAKLNDVAYMSGVSRAYVGKIVVKLKDKGLIERIGNKRTGYWKIRQA